MAIKSNLFAAVGGYHGRAGQQGKVGIFARLADRGEWEQKVADVEGCCVAVHPRDPRTIFAGTKDGIYRSKDGGATFEKMNFPFEGISVWSFLFDARDDQVIYAGGSPIMVYRSVDGGMSWVSLPNSTVPDPAENIPFKCRVMCMVQHPLKPDTIFAAMEVNGVTRTDDGGASWTNCSADLIAKADLDQYKSSILTEVDAEGMLDVHAIAIKIGRAHV